MSVLEHTIMQLQGPRGTVEFDVSPDRDEVKMTVGKEVRTFKFVDLFALTFAVASTDQQADLMPVKKTEMHTYKRIHNVKVTKHLKPGDMIKIKCEMNVEKSVTESLGGLVKSKASPIDVGVPIIGGR